LGQGSVGVDEGGLRMKQLVLWQWIVIVVAAVVFVGGMQVVV
jgi:hypothetical protein